MIIVLPEILTKFDYYIKWRMSYSCNYHCEYCIQARNDCKRRRNEQPYDVIETANKIANMIRPNTMIELVGGEISVINEIPEITALFKSKNAYLKCLTNLSKDWEFYKDFSEIRASFHPSQCNQEEFKSKLVALKQIGVIVGTEVVISTQSSEEDNQKKMDFAKWCEVNDIEITIDTDRWDENNRALKPNPLKHHSYLYIDGIKTEKKDAYLDKNGAFDSTSCKCYRGVNSLLVILDKVSICSQGEHKEFKWYDTPMNCKYVSCSDMRCMAMKIEK